MTPAAARLPPPDPISDAGTLARLAERWGRQPAIAVDTEFVRERTFYPRLGLVQVADDAGAHLLDPLALDLEPLGRLLADPAVVKVLHSAGEDVEVFFHRFGATPRNLFDTQLAAAFAGLGASLGYGALVKTLFGVELPKGETRTDWLRRPLDDAQRRYAVQDVEHLLPAWRRLDARLAELGRLGWLAEDLEAVVDPRRFAPDRENAWRRIKGAGSLDRRGLAALIRLAAWRDDEARRRDLPRSFVVQDAALLSLARARPRDLAGLRRTEGIRPSLVRRHGRTLLEVAGAGSAGGAPPAVEPVRPPSVRDILRRLKDVVSTRAAELGVPAELLATSSTLLEVVDASLAGAEPGLPPRLLGWRRAEIGDAILAAARHDCRGGTPTLPSHGASTHTKGAAQNE